jgi:hypothetical protein
VWRYWRECGHRRRHQGAGHQAADDLAAVPGDVQAAHQNALGDAWAGKSAVKPVVEQLVPQVNQKLAEYNSRFPPK